MNKSFCTVCTSLWMGAAMAADVYYWQNTLGDNDIANKANWTLNNQTTVPDSFPPALDTATTGSTHPYIKFQTGGTLALPNANALTLQDMIFPTADTDWTIDLGSKDKVISLFGNCDSCVWVGENYPSGQRVTLKSGTLQPVQSAQRHTALRIGGSNTTNAKRSWLRLDGPQAQVKNLSLQMNSPNSEFCVTNGAYAYITGDYAVRFGSNAGFDCPTSRIIVSGEGSVIEKDVNSNTGFFFGDNLNAGEVYGQNGGLIINDGGAVKKVKGIIGNRRGGYFVTMDNGSWTEGGDVILGSASTSTNNVLTARNGSTVSLASTFFVGSKGSYNRAVFDNSSLTTAGYIYVGQGGDATGLPDYGYNELIISNKSTVSSKFIALGWNAGLNSRYNRVFIDDSTVTLSENFLMGRYNGGNTGVVQNATLACGSTMCVGERSDSTPPGIGYNAIFISNTTFSASTTYVGGQSSAGGANTCNNSITVIDSTFNKSNCDWHMGLFSGGTNHVVIANSTMPLRTFSLGRKGDGYNTVLITNCTAFSASFEIGGAAGTGGSGSSGNHLRIVDSTLGSWETRTTSITLANSYGSVDDPTKWIPSRSNRVEFVRSTWYNSPVWFGVGGWNGAKAGEDDNVFVADDHSYVDFLMANGSESSVIVGYGGARNRMEVKNGSTVKSWSFGLGSTTAYHACQGTNTLYVGKDATFTCAGYFQTNPGGSTVIIEDGTLVARYYRSHYFYSDAQAKTLDDLETAEKEYGKTGAEIWGSRWILKGSHPVLRFPLEAESVVSYYTGVEFDRSTYCEIEFPAEPYAAAPIQSSTGISFADGTNYRFDCSKLAKAGEWRAYPLAAIDDGETGAISISAAELARMRAVLTAAAAENGFRCELALASDAKTLTARFRYKTGIAVIAK